MPEFKNINIQFHLPVEFLYSLFAIGTENHFYKMITDFNLNPNEEISNSIIELKENLSNFMKNEIEYFFSLSGIGYIFYQYILLHHDITDIPQLLKVFHEYEPNDLTFRIVESVCKSNMPHLNTKEYTELKLDIHKMTSLVKKTEFQDTLRQEKVIECLNNPEETKQRLFLLLSQFYKHHFSKIETHLCQILINGKEKFELLYNSNPQKFLEQYLNLTSYPKLSPTICISFFKYISWHHYSMISIENSDWFILGIYSDLLFNETLSFERYAFIFKTLSDPNRIAILKLLSERSWYGQEIAEKLNITPATISYHISFLQKSGFISFKRIDNRSYYCINKDNLTKSLEDFIFFMK